MGNPFFIWKRLNSDDSAYSVTESRVWSRPVSRSLDSLALPQHFFIRIEFALVHVGMHLISDSYLARPT